MLHCFFSYCSQSFHFPPSPSPLTDIFCPLKSSSLLHPQFVPLSLLILLCSVFVFTLVSSARPSYIPGMPATYGPHSSWSAVRPTAPHRRPSRDQAKAERMVSEIKTKHAILFYLALLFAYRHPLQDTLSVSVTTIFS